MRRLPWLLLPLMTMALVGDSAHLSGYRPPQPQTFYETPSRPAPSPFNLPSNPFSPPPRPNPIRPPQTSYQTPFRPRPPPQTSYQTPFRPRPPPQASYQTPTLPRPLPSSPPPIPAPFRPTNTYRPSPSNVVTSQKFPPGMPYDFEWGVQDDASGNLYNHVESSDGRKTEGQYQVLLPDGRIQVVKFFDVGEGFIAEVSYQ